MLVVRSADTADHPELLHAFHSLSSPRWLEYEQSTRDEGLGDGSPVAGWAPTYQSAYLDTDVQKVLRASYAALDWMRGNADRYPRIKQGP